MKSLRRQAGFSTAMTVLTWVTLLVLLSFFFSELLRNQRNPNQSVETTTLASGAREVVLERNRAGHYVSNGTINGEEVTFILDTGATGVALPLALAERLGLDKGRAIVTRTANGTARAWLTRLGSVSVGGIELHDVRATIAPGLQMNEALLGMSFLRHVEFTQRGNTLTLRQYPDA